MSIITAEEGVVQTAEGLNPAI